MTVLSQKFSKKKKGGGDHAYKVKIDWLEKGWTLCEEKQLKPR